MLEPSAGSDSLVFVVVVVTFCYRLARKPYGLLRDVVEVVVVVVWKFDVRPYCLLCCGCAYFYVVSVVVNVVSSCTPLAPPPVLNYGVDLLRTCIVVVVFSAF